MAELVYVLCALTSIVCAAMLLRAYRSSRNRLLLWSGVCFVGLALNNALMFVDLLVFPDVDLRVVRTAIASVSLLVLVHGLVGESR
jgi:phosphatidylserine synthase